MAQHLRECGDCNDMARRILSAESAMSLAMTATASVVKTNGYRKRSHRHKRLLAVALPLAAAAGIAALVLPNGSTDPNELNRAAVVAATPPFVETRTDEDFAVFNTDNPDIVVVWFFGGD